MRRISKFLIGTNRAEKREGFILLIDQNELIVKALETIVKIIDGKGEVSNFNKNIEDIEHHNKTLHSNKKYINVGREDLKPISHSTIALLKELSHSQNKNRIDRYLESIKKSLELNIKDLNSYS